ncbi:MAG: hypothetical protein HWN66_19980 [Candidatus Helarchaeota archaeon]|nr:hypothetical protein [Candidatus Helarchaeota archaeon]
MNKISNHFEEFVRRIITTSSLEISDGALLSAFENELVTKKDAVFVFFQTIYSIYEDWNKFTYNVFISDFIHNEGLSIFSVWLAEVFPFNFDALEISCPKGPSTVDALLYINYSYNEEEMNTIRRLLADYNISVNVDRLAKLLLIEAVKSISKVLSEILESEYKISTEDVVTEIRNNELIVKYKGAGRVVK